jgi:23S rRNA (guanosine2251-2'-O)-methyltransferase
MKESTALAGINAVLGALVGPERTLDRILIQRGRRGARLGEVREAARRAGVPVLLADAERLARLSGGSRHQGVVALPSAASYSRLSDLIAACQPRGSLILLDGVEDPRNLGAVIRTAAAVGARGVVIPEHRTAGLSPGATRTAAGALSRVPVARCRNIAHLARDLREKGFEVLGLDPRGGRPWDSVRYPDRMALVVGGEAKGLRPMARKACDTIVSVPLAEGVESLNLSVATGVVLYEALRRERRREGGRS